MGRSKCFGNTGAWHDVNDWLVTGRFSEINEAIEKPVSLDVLMLGLHMPSMIGADHATGFNLDRAEPRALNISRDDVCIRSATRSKSCNISAPQ